MNYLKPFDPAYCVEEERNSGVIPNITRAFFAQGSRGICRFAAPMRRASPARTKARLYMRMPANVTIEKPKASLFQMGSLCAGCHGDPSHAEGRAGEPALPIKAGRYRRWGKKARYGIAWNPQLPPVPGFSGRSSLPTLTGVRKAGLSLSIPPVSAQTAEAGGCAGNSPFRWLRRCRLTIENGIDCKVTTNGYNHFKKVEESGGRLPPRVRCPNGQRGFYSDAFHAV